MIGEQCYICLSWFLFCRFCGGSFGI